MLDATNVLRFYNLFRGSKLDKQDQTATQEKQLFSLIRRAENTQFGKDYQFSSVRSVTEFQARVPLRKYDDFWKDYWQQNFPNLVNCTWPGKIPFFCVSSGTSTGRTKYIPYTKEMVKSNSKAGLDLLLYHLANRPKSKLLGGKNFVIGGSTDLMREAEGVYSGDLSGIAAKTLPAWARPYYFPPVKYALIKDWEEKIEILVKLSQREDIRMLGGVPSWMMIFLKKLMESRAMETPRMVDMFPNLELIVHGGVNFAPYHKQFTELLLGSHAELREVYPASEGFIATADRGYGEGLRLNCDHDIFFEFVPVEELSSKNPTRHWAKDLETGVNYAVVMSTAAGLWSYVIGDTVKFIETKPLRLLVTGRTSYYLSAFGEHLTGEEIERAVSDAAEHINCTVNDYSVGPIYPEKPGELGGHLFVVEFTEDVMRDKLELFRSRIQIALCQLNEDYEAHFADGFGLKLPQIARVKPGTFAAWMKSRGKLGGQNKVPRIITDQTLFKSLQDFSQLDATSNDLFVQ